MWAWMWAIGDSSVTGWEWLPLGVGMHPRPVVPRRLRALGALDRPAAPRRLLGVLSPRVRRARGGDRVPRPVLAGAVIALLAAVLDAVLPDTARVDVRRVAARRVPGRHGREQRRAGARRTPAAALTGRAGGVRGAAWTASGMTRSLRVALGVVWETGRRPAFVRAKLRDLAVLGVLAALDPGGLPALAGGPDRRPGRRRPQCRAGARRGGDVIARVAELIVIGAATFVAWCSSTGWARPSRLAVHGRLARGAGRSPIAIDVGLAGYAFYLVNIAGLELDLRAARGDARAPGAALHRRGDGALRRRVAGLTRSG